MSRIILVISILILAPQTVLAQAHTRRVEAFVALGRHVILNQSFSKNDSRYTAGYLLYNFSETQSIGVRFGKIAYESPLSLVEWLATHRYSWRERRSVRIYLETGVGISEAIDAYDPGGRFSLTIAVGIKRFLGKHWSLGIESRGVGFKQKKSANADEIITANELTLVLGYLF